MSTTFHIIDSISQDVEGDTVFKGYFSDEEQGYKKKKTASNEEAPKDPARLRMNIYLFGKTAAGENVRACVTGFTPFFFVRLPNNSRKVKEDFNNTLEGVLKNRRQWAGYPVQVDFVKRKLLYGYTAGEAYTFAKLTVASGMAFRALRKLFLEMDTSTPKFTIATSDSPLEVYEANLDPMLRFFHLRDIKPCGWVRTGAELEEGELTIDWDDVHPATGPVAAAPFLMAAWDIESYSENGEFTLAKKGYARLAKQLYSLAETPQAAANLIINAATGNPAEGMDHLRHRTTLKLADLQGTVSSDLFVQKLTPLLIKKDGLSISSRDERIRDLTKILDQFLRKVLPLAGDPIIQIGTVLVVGSTVSEKHVFVSGSCDDIPGVIVHRCKGERAVIIEWAAAMVKWNPDILMGYNVFGYDEKYLWERSEELGITQDLSIQGLSRMLDMNKQVILEEKFLSSSAMGDNMLYMWSTFGRLQVDLFQYVKRNFSLPAYKLDYVCQHFMSGKCGGVDYTSDSGGWRIKTKQTGDVVVGRSIVLLDETGDTIGEKFRVLAVEKGAYLLVETPVADDTGDLKAMMPDVVKWATVKDDVSPQDIFRLHRDGGSTGRATVAAYCVQDCDLTVELYKKLDVFNNAMAMSNACSVPIAYIFTRGQGIKIESLIFKECYKREQCVLVLPTQSRQSGAEEPPQDSYEGAYVFEPKPGIYYESPIGVADFASLYPSTIISENISHDMLLWVKNYDLAGNFIGYDYGSEKATYPEGVAWTDIEFDVWGVKEGDMRKNPEKVKRGIRVCRYAQLPGNDKGTLPQIVQGLLAARKAKRKEAEAEMDPFKKALLDAEQLAYKLTANSLYGQLGSSTFKIRLQHLAASVTSYGRKQIMFAKAAIEQFYGASSGRKDCMAETVYGDTDSLFINFNVSNPVTGVPLEGEAAILATMKLTEEAGKMVTTCLKPPHDFEYDKTFSPFIIFSKKRYVGNKYEESATEYYQNSMGIATKRRDYAGIVKVIYGGAIRIILTEHDPVAAAAFVKSKLVDLAEGRVSLTQLTMTKSLRADYKSPTPPAHKVLAERIKERDPGNAPASGDRISFLYVLPQVGQQASKLQGERIETPVFMKQKGLLVDEKFYMEHQLMNPISQLFALVVEQLPGCVAPGKKAWSVADESDREYAASEYLFRDAMNICDKKSELAAMAKFGKLDTAAKKPAGNPKGRAAVPVKPAPKYLQTKINSLFGQKLLISEMEKAVALRRSPRLSPNGKETTIE